MKRALEEVRMHILQILILLQPCKGLQFEAAWGKHEDGLNLANPSHLEVEEAQQRSFNDQLGMNLESYEMNYRQCSAEYLCAIVVNRSFWEPCTCNCKN
nr:hypothetical protein CFP56_44205 [Quercus suber]